MALLTDVRYSLRQLRNSPGFSLTILATLGLCIGANTAIYSVVDAVLLRPLPYPEPDRLAMVVTAWQNKGKSGVEDSQTGAAFEVVRAGAADLDVAAFSGDGGVNFASGNEVEYIQQQRVSTGYFRVLGVPPQFGREFTPTEDKAGGPAVALLSYPFWQRVFHGSPAVLGQAINLRGEPFTVVGIMPREFHVASPIDVWTPLRPSRTGEGGGSNYGVAARLKPGVTWAQASAQLQAVGRALTTDEAEVPQGATFDQRIMPFQKSATSYLRTELLLTWGAVLVVLLIGCVNIAGLLLAHSANRRREIATRLALGGSRFAIVRQLLVESALLACAGGLLGMLIGYYALAGLKVLGAARMELWHPIELDLRVFVVMFLISLITSVIFGLAPALAASRLDIRSTLLEGGRGVAGGNRQWFRRALVMAEISLSLVLLISAGLLVRTMNYLNGLNPGFDTHNILTAQTSLQDARYQTAQAVNGLYTRSLERIRTIPGVESAAVALTLPFERPLNNGFRTVDGANDQQQGGEMVYSTPGYFGTMRIPVLAGREFRDSDTSDSAQVAIVSESFARKQFPGHNAIGRHLRLGKTTVVEIVGIVGDVQQHSGLGNYGPLSIEPTFYVPAAQMSDKFLQLVHTWFPPKWVVRGRGSSATLAVEVQRAVAAVDPRLPVANFRPIEELRSRITGSQRYQAVLFSMVAGLALLLASIGLYGLISHSVTQRTREMGIRMALGASVRGAILGLVKPGLLIAFIGVLIGLGASFATARLLRSLIWGVRSVDPITFVSTALLLLVVATLATVLPALRLLRLDPAQTLRDE